MTPEKKKDVLNFMGPLAAAAVEYITVQLNENIGLGIERPDFKDINNITREMDKSIHALYHSALRREFGSSMIFTGEEAKKSDSNAIGEFIASVDSLDGTDLAAKGFYNWGTAAFVFVPNEEIFASVVGMPSSKLGKTKTGTVKGVPSACLYYASKYGAFKQEPGISGDLSDVKLVLSKKKKALKNASICFYGQKAGNFLSVFKRLRFVKKLKELSDLSTNGQSIPLRIYNFGGNPMLAKLAEGTVDAVIELKGQVAYDVLPGAFIAQQAGAFLGDLHGNKIDSAYLIKKGFLSDGDKNDKKLTYIAASSKYLYNELLTLLR